MTWQEQAVYDYLKANPQSAFNRKEISKKAVKRKVYEEDPNWALAAFSSLLNEELIEKDDSGHYRFMKAY
jgi:hypothetical protein